MITTVKDTECQALFISFTDCYDFFLGRGFGFALPVAIFTPLVNKPNEISKGRSCLSLPDQIRQAEWIAGQHLSSTENKRLALPTAEAGSG